MLTRCNLNLTQNPFGEVQPEAVGELIQKEFGTANGAVALVETTATASLVPLSSVNLAEILPFCLRLIVITEDAELRLEAVVENKSRTFAYRLLRETPGDTYVMRTDALLLRQTKHIAPELYANGRGRMNTREYYQENEDGMYVFVAERLAGSSE